jgi:hypothetical protein
MNKPFTATRRHDGVTLPDSTRRVLRADDEIWPPAFPEPEPVRRAVAVAAKSDADISLQIAEPLRFHWARYAHLTHCLQGKCHLAAALLSGLILSMLAWKAENGAHISPERWLFGLVSGWFIICMIRLALFTCLAAPRFICYAHGQLRISGLGTLRADQILHWSIEHKVSVRACARPGAQLQICYRWLGYERHWTMLMEDGPETAELERQFEAQLPHRSSATEQSLGRTIQIEAGMLSQ